MCACVPNGADIRQLATDAVRVCDWDKLLLSWTACVVSGQWTVHWDGALFQQILQHGSMPKPWGSPSVCGRVIMGGYPSSAKPES